MRGRVSLSLIAILGMMLACGDGGGGPIGPGDDDGSGTVGPAGGTVRLGDEAGVVVPAGALDTEVTITITDVAMPAALGAAGAIAQAYRFAPEALQFQLPVEVFVFVPTTALTGVDPSDLTLLATEPSGFEELTGITVDIGGNGITVRGHVNHFSIIAAAVREDLPPPNRAPTARAGADQSASAGDGVTLDGSGSSDPDDDPLTFAWRNLSAPGGVTVSLIDGATAQAGFTPTTTGTYAFELTVSDGELAARDTVLVTVVAANRLPVVDAGIDQSVTLGEVATVTATASDADGDPLTYSWTIVSRPEGSTAALSATGTPTVSLTPDVAGAYVLQVTVGDGSGAGVVDSVKVTASAPGMNRAPIADAGFDLNGTETIPVSLQGTGSSDPDGDPLTYSWTFLTLPAGSTTPSIIAASAPSASFVPDVEGVYVVQLEVSDGEFSSTDTATITVVPFNSPPQGTLTLSGSAQILAGESGTAIAAFTDMEGAPLDFTWSLDVPAGSFATLVLSGGETQATFTADVPGDYLISVSVTDGAKTTESAVTVTAYPRVAGTYTTEFTVTFISPICQDELALTPGQFLIRDMLVTQTSASTAELGINALIPNVRDNPEASLSPDGLAVFAGPLVLDTGQAPPDDTITVRGNITLQFLFGSGIAFPATGFDAGTFSFTASLGFFSCTVQGTMESPPS